jgi:PAS domain S-box-containing protein
MADTSSLVIDPPTLRRLLEQAPGYIIVFDLDLRIHYMNRVAPGFRMEEAIGSELKDYLPPEELERLMPVFEGIRQHGRPSVIETPVEHNDGTRHWYVSRAAALRDQHGTIIGYVLMADDITAQKRVEQELQKTQGRLSDVSQRAGMVEMATGVLHNVGNVLNSVNVSAATLRQELSSAHIDMLARTVKLCEEQGEKLPEFLTHDPRGQRVMALLARVTQQLVNERQRLRAEVQRMVEHVSIIRSTVEVQQSVAKSGALLEDTTPEELVERTLSMFRGDLERQRVEVEVEAEPGLRLQLDRQGTLQILVNLVGNAIEALGEVEGPRKLRIHIYASNGRVSVEVEDNGRGITPDNLASIFRHGFTTKKTGHGFGLHASAIAAKAMGGSLTVESEGPGHGARFCLSLPQHSPPQAPQHSPPQAPSR